MSSSTLTREVMVLCYCVLYQSVYTALVITVTRCHVSAKVLQGQLHTSTEKCEIRIRPENFAWVLTTSKFYYNSITHICPIYAKNYACREVCMYVYREVRLVSEFFRLIIAKRPAPIFTLNTSKDNIFASLRFRARI